MAETGPEAAAAAVPRLAVHPQVPRGHRAVHHRRGLLDHADGLGRRDDAAVGVQRRRLVTGDTLRPRRLSRSYLDLF